MPRLIAFLRAINVGGRNVKMAELRRYFETLGLTSVETFLASGNVLFEAEEEAGELEPRIEDHLRRQLGYEVATFVRTPQEIHAVCRTVPWSARDIEAAGSLNVGFLKEPLDPGAKDRLADLASDIDDLTARGRELYWRCAQRQSESKLSNALLERRLRVVTTLRGLKTLTKLAAKLALGGAGE